MSRFYVSPEDIKDNKIYIKGTEAHHIVGVLRLNKGDKICAFDGTGKEYLGSIQKAARGEVVVWIEEVNLPKREKPFTLTLAQALSKKAKMDEIVRRCTELGVDYILPIQTRRTVVKLESPRVESRRRRWERIAKEASKQCGRTRVTEVLDIKDLKDIVGEIGSYDLALIFCLAGQTQPLKGTLANYRAKMGDTSRRRKVIIFIGPEGDFTPQEIEEARKNGAIPVSLGANVLRCDTAAIVSCAILNYELGQWI